MEVREGDVVKGSYSLNEADGTVRVVDYTADPHNGFNAVVKRIGHAAHPQVVSHGHGVVAAPVVAAPVVAASVVAAPVVATHGGWNGVNGGWGGVNGGWGNEGLGNGGWGNGGWGNGGWGGVHGGWNSGHVVSHGVVAAAPIVSTVVAGHGGWGGVNGGWGGVHGGWNGAHGGW